jgi:hypothetical protein
MAVTVADEYLAIVARCTREQLDAIWGHVLFGRPLEDPALELLARELDELRDRVGRASRARRAGAAAA